MGSKTKSNPNDPKSCSFGNWPIIIKRCPGYKEWNSSEIGVRVIISEIGGQSVTIILSDLQDV